MTSGTPLPATPLRPYPEYRESEVSWLGRVPAHWEVRPTKRVFRHIVGGSTPKTGESRYWDGDVVWVTPSDISRTHVLKSSARYITSAGRKSCSLELVPPDSIVLTSRAPVGNVAMAATSLCTNQGCKALIPKEGAQPRFYYFALTVLKEELQARAVGTTFGEISTERLATVPLPVPPLDEQRAAVRFLDDAFGRIHRYVAAKERMIELLGEQKQAIIHLAVTRGLDPGVPRKPSGVSWLGDIPAHWTVVRLGRLFEQRKESGPVHLPILEVSLKTGVRVRKFSGSHRKQVMEDRTGYQRATRGDIAYNMMRMWQGAVGVVPEDGLVSPAYVVARPTPLTDPRYFSSLFRTAGYRRGVDMNSRGIVKDRNRLYWQDFKQLPAPCPPYAEQRSIVEYLARARADIDRAVERARRQVELLVEYRKRLVVEVVTGKLDVRQTPLHPKRDAQDGPESTLLRSC